MKNLKNTCFIMVGAVCLTACSTNKPGYTEINEVIQDCTVVSAIGPSGDWAVCCQKTMALEEIANQTPDSKFVSVGMDTITMPETCDILINVVPSMVNPGNGTECYRVKTFDSNFSDPVYAVTVCDQVQD